MWFYFVIVFYRCEEPLTPLLHVTMVLLAASGVEEPLRHDALRQVVHSVVGLCTD